jgi:DNA-binding transcriptional regulator YdaS (Cro superfamily)
MSFKTLQRAISKAGNQSEFARLVGTSQQLVSYWVRNRKPLPAEYVLAAEKAFGISRHDFRSDIYPREDAA